MGEASAWDSKKVSVTIGELKDIVWEPDTYRRILKMYGLKNIQAKSWQRAARE
jgi:hypothetical protein